MSKKKYDFSGYATKFDIKCSDGRTIRKDAFKHQNGQTIPLVWHHKHSDPKNILGHALLEYRDDGMYAYGTFNDTESGKNTKLLVHHKDIKALSIHANELQQKGSDVVHGSIKEVSLVLAGANIGALIDNLYIEHSDGSLEMNDGEAIIYSGEEITHSEDEDDTEEKETKEEAKEKTKEETKEELDHADGEKTLKDVFDTFNEEQKNVVYAMIAHAMDNESDNLDHNDDEGGTTMKKNVFDNKGEDTKKNTLTHAQVQTIMTDAQKCGSLKEAILSHAVEYGIENIDYLFPDARNITPTPDMITRDMAWVSGVISGTKHSPFSRIKSMAADITADEARAKGYVKGNKKTEEVIGLLRRTTTPTTVYKKQKLDRDDIIDITDLDVVSWLKAEMRVMLDEELARALLIGDGREVESDDKIDEACIRPIYKDDDMYSHHVRILADREIDEIIDDIIRARTNYKGSGNPKLYMAPGMITEMLLLRDTIGRRLFSTEAELASALRVSSIVEVPIMENVTRDTDDEVPVTLGLIGIMVNLNDYVMGADKGGAISMFDDFDIDYNQYKYLIETRCSGCLTKPKSALVIEQVIEQS